MTYVDLAELIAGHIAGLLERDCAGQDYCAAEVTASVMKQAIEVMQAHGYTVSEATAICDRAVEKIRALLVAKDIQRIVPDVGFAKKQALQIDEFQAPGKRESIKIGGLLDRLDKTFTTGNEFPKHHVRQRLRDVMPVQDDCTEEVLAAASRIACPNS